MTPVPAVAGGALALLAADAAGAIVPDGTGAVASAARPRSQTTATAIASTIVIPATTERTMR